MKQTDLLRRIKTRLEALYGSRFRGLVLYGSMARGDADDESDIDLLCLLDGPVDAVEEIRPIVKALSSLQNENPDRAISVKAVDEVDYKEGAYPLVIEAGREGMPV